MRRLFLILAGLALLAISIGAGYNAAGRKAGIVGTWQPVSEEFGGQNLLKPGIVTIKMNSGSHFMWMAYDKTKMITTGSGSGSYTVNGDTYVEHVDFAWREGGSDQAKVIGTEITFKIKIDGDTLTQTGQILGRDFKEVYKRVD
jgi:hypothetical protein